MTREPTSQRMLLGGAAVVAALFAQVTSAQPAPNREERVAQYAATFSSGRLAEAESLARAAAEISRRASDPPHVQAGIYRDIAVIQLAMAQNAAAVDTLRRTLAMLSGDSTPEAVELRRAVRTELVRAFKRLGELEQAHAVYEEMRLEEGGNVLKGPVYAGESFGISSLPPILDHAYAFLARDEPYSEKAGLYSYVLLRRGDATQRARNVELLAAFMLDGSEAAQRIMTDNAYLNVILVPVLADKIQMAYDIAAMPADPLDRARALEESSYDSAFATDIRLRFCQAVADKPPPCNASGAGPVVLVLDGPIETFDGASEAYLIADLDGYGAEAIRNVASVLREIIAARGDETFRQNIQWLRGRMLSVVLDVADVFSPIDSARADPG